MSKILVREARDIDAENAYYVTTESGTVAVHTNRRGDGLWIDGKQVEGTSQFSLHGITHKIAKIRRYFGE